MNTIELDKLPKSTQPIEKPKLMVTAVLSLLHEPADRNSCQRKFRGEAVLTWTLRRLQSAQRISGAVILCWADQLSAAEQIAQTFGIRCFAPAERGPLFPLDAISASRRWADGWRGGLLGTCDFDRGFHAPWVMEIQSQSQTDAVLLVDPAAGLIDPTLVDQVIEHSDEHAEIDFFFSPAAPGLSGILLRNKLLKQLASGRSFPGTLTGYHPDVPQRDPLASPACVEIPAPLARTTRRFTLDSDRQIARLTRATDALGSDILSCSASELLDCCDTADVGISLPREMVLELTTHRATKPIFAASTHLKIERADLSLVTAQKLFDELGQADDMRLVLGGVGDPLLHGSVFEIIDMAQRAGIAAISIETDFVGIEPGTIQKLVSSNVDVVSVCLPGASAKTYLAMMGVDAVKAAVDHLREFIELRQALGRCTPILTPTFVKSALNLADMEPWYDHWLRTVGCAVIVSPGDFAGQIPETAAVRMEPPRRRAARLAKRLTVLCDGTVVSCEQDVLGKQALGQVNENSISQIWTGAAARFQKDHQLGHWDKHELCAGCCDWHRP